MWVWLTVAAACIVVIVPVIPTALLMMAHSASMSHSEPPAPTDCSDVCFDRSAVGDSLATEDALADLGVPVVRDAWGSVPDSTATEQQREAVSFWDDRRGAPSSCFFTAHLAPVVEPRDAALGFTEADIFFTGVHTNDSESATLIQSARVFATSADAVDHMDSVAEAVDGCTSYAVFEKGTPVTYAVSMAPSLDLPGSVRSAGWVSDGPDGAMVSVTDVQRGNIVLRSVLRVDEAVSAEQAEAFTESMAAGLAALDLPGEVT